jgi:hypothetical protein
MGFGSGRGDPVPEPGWALRSSLWQSHRRSPPISLLCLANTGRQESNRSLSRRRRESLSVSSFAVEHIDVSTDSAERPRSCPWSSCGIDEKKETVERPLGQSRARTNARPSDARSHPLRGRLPTSSCWTLRLSTPHEGRSTGRSDAPRRRGGLERLGRWPETANTRKHPTARATTAPTRRTCSLHRLPFKDRLRATRSEKRRRECLQAHHGSQHAQRLWRTGGRGTQDQHESHGDANRTGHI